jgi:hypothetical protein
VSLAGEEIEAPPADTAKFGQVCHVEHHCREIHFHSSSLSVSREWLSLFVNLIWRFHAEYTRSFCFAERHMTSSQ